MMENSLPETISRVTDMIGTLTEFTALLEHETAAIRRADTETIAKVAERKQFLALHYQRQLRMLADRRSDLPDLPQPLRTKLLDYWQEFDAAVLDNTGALKAAQQATRLVVDMIVSAIREGQPMRRDSGYQQHSYGPHLPAADCISVSLNRIL